MQQAKLKTKPFDFDSLEQVKGESFRKPLGVVPFIIENLAAIDVALIGAWVCKWWYFGGFKFMYMAFAKFLPWLLAMVFVG